MYLTNLEIDKSVVDILRHGQLVIAILHMKYDV